VSRGGVIRWGLLIALPVLLGAASLFIGRYHIGLSVGMRALLFGGEPIVRGVLLRVRLPRIMAALCIGANLGVSGAVFQGIFRNPLVDSRILGVSSGAAFGAALALLFARGPVGVEGFAFGFSLLAVGLVLFVGERFGASILALVVTGVLVSAFFNALVGLIKYVADPLNTLPAITYWLLGGLNGVRWADLGPLFLITGVGLAFFLLIRWRVNLLTLDAAEGAALGIAVKRFRLVVIGVGTLLVAASVSVSGIIGWIGLIVPHAARGLVGPEHSRLIPASLALGAATLLVLDDVSRTALTAEIPLGILAGLIGVPAFLFLFMRVLRARHGGWR